MNHRIACIGCGYWGKNLVRNYHEVGALAAVCEPDPDIRETVKSRYPNCLVTDSLETVLKDDSIAAVSIATPAETHADLVRESVLAGKDVFVEKPLCLSVREGRELIGLARHHDRILMVGHLLWYHPAVLKLKELVETGELGRIQYIYSNRLNLGKIRREENILWSFAPHDLSVILGLLGEMPDTIEAQGGNYLHHRIADVTVSLLSFPSGVKAHLFVSWLHPYKEQKLVVVGERKMAVFDDVAAWPDKLLLFPHSIDWKNNVPVANKAEAERVHIVEVEPLRAECDHFLEALETRRPPRTDGSEGLRVLSVLERCQQALEAERGPSQKAVAAEPSPHLAYYAHETAVIDQGVQIGKGSKIWHFTHLLRGSKLGENCNLGQNVMVGPNVTLGNGCKLQNSVSVYEGVTLEDDVFCGPSMVFTNVSNPRAHIVRRHEFKETLVKRGATIGANATVVCGRTLGRYCFIGAGAVVTKDVPDYALMVGMPARQVGWVCQCAVSLRVEQGRAVCPACGHKYVEADGLLREDDSP